MHARGEHYKAIFGPWWAIVNGLWTLLSSADTLVGKYGSDTFKKTWEAAWIAPKWGWKVWVIGILASTVIFAVEYSFRHVNRSLERNRRDYETELKKVKDELEAKKLEFASLTTKPDISGKIIVAFWEVYRDINETPWSKHSRYYIKLRLTNQNDVPCTIDQYSIAVANYYTHKNGGGEGKPSSTGRLIHLTYNYTDEDTEIIETSTSLDTRTRTKPIDISPQWPLEKGCKHEGWVTFDVWNYRPEPVKPDDTAPETFLGHWQECVSVFVVDSLGNTHTLTDVIADVAPARFERA
jgi:hypothetical protein